jgi:hypothetical protein
MVRRALPFDHVVITEAGVARRMNLADFLEMPLPGKIRHVLSRTIEFYDGATLVDRKVALASLRESAKG